MKLNKDVVGWITIFDTHISYPVVQGKDNQEYLNKDVFGKFSFSGSIFLDYRNACDFTDSYSIIYGHHMEYGAMFGDVVEFKNDDYFQEHKTGALFLLDDTYKITLFACVETQEFNNKIYNPTVQGKDNLDTLLKYIKDEVLSGVLCLIHCFIRTFCKNFQCYLFSFFVCKYHAYTACNYYIFAYFIVVYSLKFKRDIASI